MKGRRKASREKDLTSQYFSGRMEEDRLEPNQRQANRTHKRQPGKTIKTARKRSEESSTQFDMESLPVGQVVQVYSRYCEVEKGAQTFLCVTRKTLQQISMTQLVVGDLVKFRITESRDELGRPEGVVEQALPRKSIVTRADSFQHRVQHPIVANADRMLIVAGLLLPQVKWGLVDRMMLAARSGGLEPVICLNKVDLAQTEKKGIAIYQEAVEALAYYKSIGIGTIQTSAVKETGLEELKEILKGKTTVLAGHSGVGKSSLIRAIQPQLDLRIGAISGYTGKGRHTTTSARRYPLDFGGYVVDTPGVKMFGLWQITRENISDYFQDITSPSAPQWRKESYARILEGIQASY